MSGVLSLAARLGQGCKREPFPVAFGPRAARAPGNIRGHFSRTKSHRRAQSGWDSLTLTESKIAELVEEGLSNPEIAAKLLLSRRTVATHVSHILRKLGVHSRTDIAREAALRSK